MLFDFFADLNWLAVVVAAVAYFVLGALWYSNFLFGKQYRAALGVTEGAGTPPTGPLVTNLVGWIVAAIAMGLISKAIGATDWVDGLVLGLVVSIGFVWITQLVSAVYGGGMALVKVNTPYNVIGFVIMGVILAVWQ